MTFQFRNCQNSRTLWFPLSDMWLQFWIHRHYQQNSWGDSYIFNWMFQPPWIKMWAQTWWVNVPTPNFPKFPSFKDFPTIYCRYSCWEMSVIFWDPLYSPVARRSKILILASLLEMPGPLAMQWISFNDLRWCIHLKKIIALNLTLFSKWDIIWSCPSTVCLISYLRISQV